MDEIGIEHERATAMKADSSASSVIASLSVGAVDSPFKELSIEPTPPSDVSVLDPDGDRIGGYVWKFPSEGSNTLLRGASSSTLCDSLDPQAAVAYPRKCRYCQCAWVSSYVNERRHWKLCPADASASRGNPSASSWGVPRRVWCEVDSALTCIQWRQSPTSSDTCRITFQEITDVVLLSEPRESFQVATRAGRRVVFQCRNTEDSDDQKQKGDHAKACTPRALDARQWTEYLQVFSRFAQDHDKLETICEDEDEPIVEAPNEKASGDKDGMSEIQEEIQRVMAANELDALEEILHDDELSSSARLLTDCHGSSLLIQAVQLDANLRIIQALLEAHVDCNAKNHDCDSPLLLAAASGDTSLLQLLLQAPDIRVNQRCALGVTAFHAAANAGDVKMLRVLCDHGQVVTTYVDENGWTALHYAAACAAGRDAMAFLCELLPDLVDAQCIQGNTALHVAAGCGREQNLRVLLETAANPHVANSDGHTAYRIALQNHHIACAMAVHEYMEAPRDAYERVMPVPSAHARKEDHVARVETTGGVLYHEYGRKDLSGTDEWGPTSWVECYTDDQIPYYYNSITGESTWHKPELMTLLPPPPPPPRSTNDHGSAAGSPTATSSATLGNKLPLCMIPLVSPLVSLDDPTAATKLDARRRKDRARRRSQKIRHVSMAHATEASPPVSDPPTHSQQRRRLAVRHYDVQ